MPSTRFHKAAQIAALWNTWNRNDIAEAINERLYHEKELGIEVGFGSLLDAWKKVDTRSPAHRDFSYDNPLACLYFHVSNGYYPPPEILISISRCIGEFLQAKGNKSLDEAFSGQTGSKRRSYAFKANGDVEYRFFHECFSHAKSREGPKNKVYKTKEARAYLGKYPLDRDIELKSFLRGYDRWCNKNQGQN